MCGSAKPARVAKRFLLECDMCREGHGIGGFAHQAPMILLCRPSWTESPARSRENLAGNLV